MLENLTGFYREADGQTKRKILGCIFSEKLVFEKGRKSCNYPLHGTHTGFIQDYQGFTRV